MTQRILNASLTPRVPTLPVAEPDVREFYLHGERVLFDCNSLCAVHAPYSALRTPHSEIPGSRSMPQFALARSAPIRRVVLNLTNDCNLACSYCFRRAADSVSAVTPHSALRTPQSAMSVETARKAVRLIDPGSRMDIAFFGGEPLLAWDLIRLVMADAAEIAASRKIAPARRGGPAGVQPPKFHITTNGTLLDDEKIAFLSGQPCSILISLDGPQDLHDAARPMRSPAYGGQSSFTAVMAALDRAQGTLLGKRIMARSTFTAANPQLVRRLEFFADLNDSGLINGYSVEPAVLTEGCAARSASSVVGGLSSLSAEYHAAAEWFVSRVNAGLSANFFHFRKLLDRILYARHSGTECGAGNGYVTVAPDGTIHACHREGTPVGHVDTGVSEALRAPWSDNRIYARAHCMRCWARYLCGGGCRQACLELSGDLHASAPERCLITQTMLKECLWILTRVPREKLLAALAPKTPPPPAAPHSPLHSAVPRPPFIPSAVTPHSAIRTPHSAIERGAAK